MPSSEASGSLSSADLPESRVVQVMHHGPFKGEFETLARLGAFARERGLRRSGPHREIHIDPFTAQTPQDALRTILRDPVA
ncbi:GyrI-like domain-containing protein [Streptomyces tendae]|uniref:GyrI-like domain-containing protein n=1 Tax=Streptomyces tendae TaxID=1932 RepID=UPI00365BEC00